MQPFRSFSKDKAMDNQSDSQQPGRLTFLLLTQAYNRNEISFDEWLKLTREWAEAVIARCKTPLVTQPEPGAPD